MKSREDGFSIEKHNSSITYYEERDQCYQQLWYPHQDIIESIVRVQFFEKGLEIFLVVAVISIPVMLFVKPFVLRYKAARGEVCLFSIKSPTL